MQWAEVSIQTTHEATDVVAEIYHDLGASGVVIEDPELLNNYIDAGQWDFSGIERAEDTSIVTVKAYLPVDEDLDDKLRTFELRIKDFKSMTDDDMEKGPCTISWNTVRDEDWADNWKAYFHPEKVGGMLVIKPTWEDYEASPDDIVIELDPGSAFGTGTHPTTAMCLRELETLVKGGMRIFDVGTGSGVLSIAAAKLGATDVTAMDYDKVAVDVAAENIRQNGVEDVVKTGVSDILKSFDGKADLIVANIIADIIIMLFDELDEHLAEGGRLLASGIISERLADVTEACLAHGFVVDKVTEEKGWVAMTISRGENK
ncbi:MAG: 50S ribosomal protein L11 methyltransferase [Selenomonas ruminantium]|uniref:Ribosomal protein L11 methyltransferase n=1 Tax=Selenomonas ruminantium TaxID=971 RepID=A0A1H3WCD2_SELRU|nr:MULTISPECIES: 50S ribosomal protein L11 methyltransferase [Selenomonas]MBE6084570.1 50S ribosomal protein L11 methyltransferase [Selenomonas ruminantium]SDZ84002.1 ribosomal protein L11 methyltransferase [Selenomonas ruminantium]SFA85379.1 ribosomal protein L11 methyltransferase [Selenomonas ruminantium]